MSRPDRAFLIVTQGGLVVLIRQFRISGNGEPVYILDVGCTANRRCKRVVSITSCAKPAAGILGLISMTNPNPSCTTVQTPN
eukprot:s18_g30.t1